MRCRRSAGGWGSTVRVSATVVACAGLASIPAFLVGMVLAALYRDHSPVYYSTGTMVMAGILTALAVAVPTARAAERLQREVSSRKRTAVSALSVLALLVGLALFIGFVGH